MLDFIVTYLSDLTGIHYAAMQVGVVLGGGTALVAVIAGKMS